MTKRYAIQILYTERCRFLPLAVERVRDALSLRDDNLDVEVRLILVESFSDAVARRFRGSPTVRIDDHDVETRGGPVGRIGLMPRGYMVDTRVERAPSVTSIRRALDDVIALERARTSVKFVRTWTSAPVMAEVST